MSCLHIGWPYTLPTGQACDLHVSYRRLDIRRNSMKMHETNKWNAIPGNIKMAVYKRIQTNAVQLVFYLIKTISTIVGCRHNRCTKTTIWWQKRNRLDCLPSSVSANEQWNLYILYIWRNVLPLSKNYSLMAHFTTIHYNDVKMGAIASQITRLTIVYSTVYSGADQRKHQSSASLAFVRGIHRGPVNPPHKWPVTRKMFWFDDVIM